MTLDIHWSQKVFRRRFGQRRSRMFANNLKQFKWSERIRSEAGRAAPDTSRDLDQDWPDTPLTLVPISGSLFLDCITQITGRNCTNSLFTPPSSTSGSSTCTLRSWCEHRVDSEFSTRSHLGSSLLGLRGFQIFGQPIEVNQRATFAGVVRSFSLDFLHFLLFLFFIIFLQKKKFNNRVFDLISHAVTL